VRFGLVSLLLCDGFIAEMYIRHITINQSVSQSEISEVT